MDFSKKDSDHRGSSLPEEQLPQPSPLFQVNKFTNSNCFRPPPQNRLHTNIIFLKSLQAATENNATVGNVQEDQNVGSSPSADQDKIMSNSDNKPDN